MSNDTSKKAFNIVLVMGRKHGLSGNWIEDELNGTSILVESPKGQHLVHANGDGTFFIDEIIGEQCGNWMLSVVGTALSPDDLDDLFRTLAE